MYVKPGCISLSLDVHVSSVSNYGWVISSSPYVHNEKPVIINYRGDHNNIIYHVVVVQIGFNPTDYTVSENMEWVTFFIEKKGTNERDVTVSFSTVDGNATGKVTMKLLRQCNCECTILVSSQLLETIMPQPTSLSPSDLLIHSSM